MSTAARKARKRAGIKFIKQGGQTGTPFEDRAVPMVGKKVDGVFGQYPSNRALKRLKHFADAAKGLSRWV